jgi:RHS repeat-associated protein
MLFVAHMRSPREQPRLSRSAGPVWTNITVNATGQASVSGNALLPKTPETFAFDGDGNLVQDGLWSYTWDAENRLIAIESGTGVPPVARQRVEFAYDWQGRRTQKVVSTWNGSAYVPQYTNRFVYDGWNLAVTLASDLSPLASFTWGLDLSGSLHGAGGVGGLLWMTIPSGTNAGMYFYAYDGNGNEMALVSAADGSIAARYEYGPCGEVIRATGPMAKANPLRWSTRYQDDETDIVMYPGRPYRDGRFLTRDPAQEMGGPNPYCFVGNNPISRYDALGLWGSDVHNGGTTGWANQLGIASDTSSSIGAADEDIDNIYNPTTVADYTWSWHFNRATSGDSRLTHRDQMVRLAERLCKNPTDNASQAAVYLGYGLHPLQDWVAHADYNRKAELPLNSSAGLDTIWLWHNWAGGGYFPAQYPDSAGLDANGPDGRATADVMHWLTIANGEKVGWTEYHGGNQRITLTEKLTKELLSGFQDYVRANAKPCGECRKKFLQDN